MSFYNFFVVLFRRTQVWSVDDAQTSELMKGFYGYLKIGLEKDAALRQAKLDHIALGAHPDPYFWAGFIAAGNMEPISLHSTLRNYAYLAILILSVLLFWGVINIWKRSRLSVF